MNEINWFLITQAFFTLIKLFIVISSKCDCEFIKYK